MLIPVARKVLKSINYLCEGNKSTSSLDITLYFHNRINDLDLLNTIKYLVDEGYIIGDNRGYYWENIELTYKGKHYSQFSWVSTKKFLIQSILVPIVVAFFTSLITYLLF